MSDIAQLMQAYKNGEYPSVEFTEHGVRLSRGDDESKVEEIIWDELSEDDLEYVPFLILALTKFSTAEESYQQDQAIWQNYIKSLVRRAAKKGLDEVGKLPISNDLFRKHYSPKFFEYYLNALKELGYDALPKLSLSMRYDHSLYFPMVIESLRNNSFPFKEIQLILHGSVPDEIQNFISGIATLEHQPETLHFFVADIKGKANLLMSKIVDESIANSKSLTSNIRLEGDNEKSDRVVGIHEDSANRFTAKNRARLTKANRSKNSEYWRAKMRRPAKPVVDIASADELEQGSSTRAEVKEPDIQKAEPKEQGRLRVKRYGLVRQAKRWRKHQKGLMRRLDVHVQHNKQVQQQQQKQMRQTIQVQRQQARARQRLLEVKQDQQVETAKVTDVRGVDVLTHDSSALNKYFIDDSSHFYNELKMRPKSGFDEQLYTNHDEDKWLLKVLGAHRADFNTGIKFTGLTKRAADHLYSQRAQYQAGLALENLPKGFVLVRQAKNVYLDYNPENANAKRKYNPLSINNISTLEPVAVPDGIIDFETDELYHYFRDLVSQINKRIEEFELSKNDREFEQKYHRHNQIRVIKNKIRESEIQEMYCEFYDVIFLLNDAEYFDYGKIDRYTISSLEALMKDSSMPLRLRTVDDDKVKILKQQLPDRLRQNLAALKLSLIQMHRDYAYNTDPKGSYEQYLLRQRFLYKKHYLENDDPSTQGIYHSLKLKHQDMMKHAREDQKAANSLFTGKIWEYNLVGASLNQARMRLNVLTRAAANSQSKTVTNEFEKAGLYSRADKEKLSRSEKEALKQKEKIGAFVKERYLVDLDEDNNPRDEETQILSSTMHIFYRHLNKKHGDDARKLFANHKKILNQLSNANLNSLMQVYYANGFGGVEYLLNQFSEIKDFEHFRQTFLNHSMNYNEFLYDDFEKDIAFVNSLTGAERNWWQKLSSDHFDSIHMGQLRDLLRGYRYFLGQVKSMHVRIARKLRYHVQVSYEGNAAKIADIARMCG